MFSGIVEEIGEVIGLEELPNMKLWDGTESSGWKLSVRATTAVDGAYDGCSISVNGVCLTVTEFDDGSASFGLAPETLRRTNLGRLVSGSAVNLERSLPADGRNSGHFVQGHVDGCGQIVDKWVDGDSLWVKVQPSGDLLQYIVPKGFIAVDGTSLTVCEVNKEENWFTFMLISFTQQKVIIPSKKVGGDVNLEVDVIGKYVQRSLSSILERLETVEQQLQLRQPTDGE